VSGIVTGKSSLVARFPYDSADKVWPVDAESLRNYLQLDHSLDDNIVFEIGGMLPAATADVENHANRSLIRQRRLQTIGHDLLLAGLSGQSVMVNFGPVIAITAIKYLDLDGAEQTLPEENYRLSVDKETLYFKGELPELAEGPDTLWVEYEAGYGDTIASVPSEWQNIVSQVAYRKYDFRGGDSGSTSEAYYRMLDRLILCAGGSRRYG
jgi:uncharacterized phiE125 gp8 family phage protein